MTTPKALPRYVPVDRNVIDTRATGPPFITKMAPRDVCSAAFHIPRPSHKVEKDVVYQQHEAR